LRGASFKSECDELDEELEDELDEEDEELSDY
jgi:hypothetical protein